MHIEQRVFNLFIKWQNCQMTVCVVRWFRFLRLPSSVTTLFNMIFQMDTKNHNNKNQQAQTCSAGGLM